MATSDKLKTLRCQICDSKVNVQKVTGADGDVTLLCEGCAEQLTEAKDSFSDNKVLSEKGTLEKGYN